MSPTNLDPWEFASMGQLLAMAGAMERQAIDGYESLSRRMRAMERPDLAEVFDVLVLEESGHLAKVGEWTRASGAQDVHRSVDVPEALFQDDGAASMAPELLSAYRAFSTAVRNEERAFAFWTYVSAHARSDEIKAAAERMAREELGHVSALRKERRKAFHLEKAERSGVEADLDSVERELCRKLAAMPEANSVPLQNLMREADERARSLSARPVEVGAPYAIGPIEGLDVLVLAEYLLDWYIEIGDRAKTEAESERSRSFAAQLVVCMRTIRSLRGSGQA
jgi:rubrerythrin